jgi:hypothetical protein
VTFADVTKQVTYNVAQRGVSLETDPATGKAFELAQQGVLPKRRAENCEYEFQTFDYAFKTDIRPHIDLEMAHKVFDTAWFPEPKRRVRPSPTPVAVNSGN